VADHATQNKDNHDGVIEKWLTDFDYAANPHIQAVVIA